MDSKRKNRVILFASILLISFGTFNLATDIYGQDSITTVTSDTEPKNWDRVYQDIVEQLITTAGPLLAGILTLAFRWAKTKGLQISKEAEEYIISTAQSVVKTQAKIVFDKAYKNRDLLVAWGTGKWDGEKEEKLKEELKNWKKVAKKQAVIDLEVEIKSSKFKQTAVNIVGDNLGKLIERAYTKNQTDKAERAKNLLGELSKLAIDAGMLYYDKKNLTKEDKEEIIEKGIKILAKNFTFEFIILDKSNAKMHLEANLTKKLES